MRSRDISINSRRMYGIRIHRIYRAGTVQQQVRVWNMFPVEEDADENVRHDKKFTLDFIFYEGSNVCRSDAASIGEGV